MVFFTRRAMHCWKCYILTFRKISRAFFLKQIQINFFRLGITANWILNEKIVTISMSYTSLILHKNTNVLNLRSATGLTCLTDLLRHVPFCCQKYSIYLNINASIKICHLVSLDTSKWVDGFFFCEINYQNTQS